MSGDASLPIRPDLAGRTAYGAPQLDVAVRLNTNENPHPPTPDLVDAIGTHVRAVAAGLNRYPDREATVLRTRLADYLGHGLDASQVWAANGSNEILTQLVLLAGGPGRSALGFEPTYSMHSVISETNHTQYVRAPRGQDFTLSVDAAVAAVREHDPSIVFLCSPNNPTGTALEPGVVEAVHEASTGFVVVDEAYAEFSGRPSALALLAGRPRLVVTRTMSKAFALAGARVGYLAADSSVVDALHLVRLPYHLSAVTQATALAALEHRASLLAGVDDVKMQRDRMVAAMRDLGLTVMATDANFALFGQFRDQSVVWSGLLERGVLVRDVGLAGWLRVTAGSADDVDTFLVALEELRSTW